MSGQAPLVVDGRFLAGQQTGLHRVARSFVAAAREAGVELEVWAPAGASDPLVDREIRVPGGSGRAGGRLWEQIVLPAAAHGRRIWSLTNTAPLVRPGIVVVHDLAPIVGPQWFASSMRWYAAAVLAGARRAARVLTVSQAVRTELEDHRVDPGRIVVVPPELDDRLGPAPEASVAQVRERYDLRRPYAVMVGWADPRKDAATSAAAHQAVLAETAHDLVLVGAPHPTFAAVQVPDAPSIRRVGYVPDDDLVALLTGAAVLLYPSCYEGYGLPPLEALACGTPAVAADIPALRESTAGLIRLVPPGDVAGWAQALRDALAGRLSAPPAPRRPRQAVGRQLADALSVAPAASRRR